MHLLTFKDSFIENDRQLLKWAYRRPFRRSLFIKALIFIGDGPFWLITVLISALAGQLLKMEAFSRLTILLMTGLLISNVSFFLCKTNIRRRRPYADAELQRVLGMTIQNRDPGHASKELESFPSGHVLWTTLCVVLICYQLGYIYIFLIGWLVPAMIYLRLHLGVHYPSDVLAGMVMGGGNAAVTVLISPDVMRYINYYNDYSGYLFGYWACVAVFIFIGFRSWLQRV